MKTHLNFCFLKGVLHIVCMLFNLQYITKIKILKRDLYSVQLQNVKLCFLAIIDSFDNNKIFNGTS